MSDLSSLFRKSLNRNSLPIKRLFIDQLSTNKKSSKDRSYQPLKSIPKRKSKKDAKHLNFNKHNLSKKYLSKESFKKQLKFYNHQILLIMFRKIFFIIVGILFFNIFLTSADQTIILCNILLAMTVIDINLGYDILSSKIIRIIILIFEIGAYSINYYLIFLKMYAKQEQSLNFFKCEILILQLNAIINMVILNFCEPVINICQITNRKTPYMSIITKLKLQAFLFLKSFLRLFQLSRLILFSNLVFLLLTILYIMKAQQQIIFQNLFNLTIFKAVILTTFLLYCLLYFINKINDGISIQLLSTNKKQINLSLLKLECQNSNNQDIQREILKYVWNNCQSFWDTQFLSHNYIINYDFLEDYLMRQLKKIIAKLNQAHIFYKKLGNVKKIQSLGHNILFLIDRFCLQINQIYLLISISKKIKQKQNIFFIIEQINYFESTSTITPLNIFQLSRLLKKIDQNLQVLISHMGYKWFKIGFKNFKQFLHTNTKQY